MKAEFIHQPTSGQYEEKTFDLNTVWKSQIWSWVKFTTNSGFEWAGAFRGEPKETAIAEKINQVAVLTSDGFYILDADKKEILFFDQQTDFKELAGIPTKDKFIVAEYYQMGIVDKKFKVEFLKFDYEIDNVRFGKYDGNRLKVNFEKLPNYEIVNGFLNTQTWKIETK